MGEERLGEGKETGSSAIGPTIWRFGCPHGLSDSKCVVTQPKVADNYTHIPESGGMSFKSRPGISAQQIGVTIQ
jgi:hypothetical protein